MRIESGEKVYVLIQGFWKEGEVIKTNDYGVSLVELGNGEWFLKEEMKIKKTEQMTPDDWRNYGGFGKIIKEEK